MDLEGLAAAVTDDKERAQAYEVAALVSLMDGVQESAEAAMLSKLKPALNIGDDVAESIESKARKIYELRSLVPSRPCRCFHLCEVNAIM